MSVVAKPITKSAGQPMTGGADRTVKVSVRADDFDVSAELAAMRKNSPATGAIATFIGAVRDVNDDRTVGSMYLEHYPGMTEKAIEEIIADAQARWELHAITVIHRIGELNPTDQIVFVAVGAGHRGEAFDGCEFIMDYLKTKAPFWKRESTPEGERWVASRATDEDAASRW